MGTGKSAVGRELCRRTGKEFFELDEIIEQNAGRTITEIFRRDGEILDLEGDVFQGEVPEADRYVSNRDHADLRPSIFVLVSIRTAIRTPAAKATIVIMRATAFSILTEARFR